MEYQHIVRNLCGSGAMRDENNCLPAGKAGMNIREQLFLCGLIKGGSGLIKDHDPTRMKQRPGDSEPLALPLGEPGSALTADSVKPLRKSWPAACFPGSYRSTGYCLGEHK